MRAEGPLDHGKAVRELGWQPRPVEESIREAARFWVGLRAAKKQAKAAAGLNRHVRQLRVRAMTTSYRTCVRHPAVRDRLLVGNHRPRRPRESSAASSTAASATATAAGPTITIADMKFSAPLTVAPGATVTVVNSDGPEHSVTADSGNAFDVDVDGNGHRHVHRTDAARDVRLPLHLSPDRCTAS